MKTQMLSYSQPSSKPHWFYCTLPLDGGPFPNTAEHLPENLRIYGGLQQHHGSKQGNDKGNSQHQERHSENSATKGAARNQAEWNSAQPHSDKPVCSEAQPLTQFPHCKVTGFVSHGLTLAVCQSWQTGLFLCVQSCAVCNTLVSCTLDILSFNKISKEKLKKLMNTKCNGKARHSSHFVTLGLRSLTREDLSVRPARTTSQDSDSGKTGQTCNDAMNTVTYSPIEKMSKGVCVKFS